MIVLDCSQQYAEQNMEIDSELMEMLENYKYTTLPVLSHYDDKELLFCVSTLYCLFCLPSRVPLPLVKFRKNTNKGAYQRRGHAAILDQLELPVLSHYDESQLVFCVIHEFCASVAGQNQG